MTDVMHLRLELRKGAKLGQVPVQSLGSGPTFSRQICFRSKSPYPVLHSLPAGEWGRYAELALLQQQANVLGLRL